MSTVAEHGTGKSPSGKTVHYIIADLDCVSVECIPGKVSNSGKYGVNGTFFTSSNNLLGIAIGNGTAVAGGGTQTGQACNQLTKRGTMYHYDPSHNYVYLDTAVVKDATDTGASLKQIKWAIGGYSLFPWKVYNNSDEYFNDINGNGDPSNCNAIVTGSENAYRLNPKSTSQSRTAIGWRGFGRKIVLVVFQAESAWGVRKYMMEDMNCTHHAIMLDGGKSSSMRYNTGVFEPQGANTEAVYNMVTVSPDNWV